MTSGNTVTPVRDEVRDEDPQRLVRNARNSLVTHQCVTDFRYLTCTDDYCLNFVTRVTRKGRVLVEMPARWSCGSR